MVDFGGWSMPLSYPAGTIAEHLACRRDVAVFDVSHLGTIRIEGPQAYETLQRELSNDLARISPGRAQYTHLLDESDASVLDDIIVWWVAAESFEVMPNASNTTRVVSVLGGTDVTARRAILAIQGPHARQLLNEVAPEAAAVGRFRVAGFTWQGHECMAAGTGYTGEDGVECSVPSAAAGAFFRELIRAGATPAGLGARDTLRLEAGLPLHSHELGPGITPLQAGLEWVVSWSKGDFRGREALAAEATTGPARHLVGIVTASRRPPREGARVLVDGRPRGFVTSGNFSPVLERGIALALVDTSLQVTSPPGETSGVSVDIRGTEVEARIVRPPFVTAGRPAPGTLP